MHNATDEPDFSSPWHMSDAILVVEEQRFHVHRSTLSMSSPVFERMFNAEFKEKSATEIPLPGKKSREIRELLLVLYPTAKPITSYSVNFLLSLAQEYQMAQVTKRCEEYITNLKLSNEEAVRFLVVAQSFDLEKARRHCIEVAKTIPLTQIKWINKYQLIESEVGRKLAESRVELLESELHCLKIEVRSKFENCVDKIYRKYYGKPGSYYRGIVDWKDALQKVNGKEVDMRFLNSLLETINEKFPKH